MSVKVTGDKVKRIRKTFWHEKEMVKVQDKALIAGAKVIVKK